VQGKDDVRVTEVELSMSSLNSGDIFILDLFDTITLWAGKFANVQERAKAREILEGMKEKRRGQTQAPPPPKHPSEESHPSSPVVHCRNDECRPA
jgi:hypothetical protein